MSTIKLQITEYFSSDAALKTANELLLKSGISTTTLVLAWAKIARLCLQTGRHMSRKLMVNGISKVVEIDERIFNSPGFESMQAVGMIKLAESETAPSVLGDEHYEQWYQSYPYRDVNGKSIKIRGKSKIRFHNEIRSQETFEALMNATNTYSQMCNKKPRDAERFLLNSFWKEYCFDVSSASSKQKNALSEEDLDSLMNAN
jgi:hypothetical protein